jgi:hypothetical protein
MATILRRAATTGVPMNSLVKALVPFATTARLEKVHPLQGGLLRLKRRSERRPGLPRENIAILWLRFAWETLYKPVILAGTIGRLLLLKTAISRNPYAKAYRDKSLMPVADDEEITLDLLTKTTRASVAVAHLKKVAELTSVGQGATRGAQIVGSRRPVDNAWITPLRRDRFNSIAR